MKYLGTIAALASLAAAVPSLEVRQTTANDLEQGSCKPIFLIFARASTEIGNMGESMGPTVCSGLKRKYPNQVGCQGVGGPYSAGLIDNVSAKGTTQAAIGEAQKMFNDAVSKCPSAKIVFGGYSQGTAVMLNAVSTLDDAVKNKLLGGVLFGYTKNGQEKGTIPNYPSENLQVYCRSDDGVCAGQLRVTIGHFGYLTDGSGAKAVTFLSSKIDGAGSATSSSSGTSAGSSSVSPPSSGIGPLSSGSAASSSGLGGLLGGGMGGMAGMGGASAGSAPTDGSSSGLIPAGGASASGSSGAGASGSSGTDMSGMAGMGGS